MSKKKKDSTPDLPKPNDGWVYLTEIQINGRNVSKGTELKVRGERGRFRFLEKVETGTTEWLNVWGGPKGSEHLRSFRVEQVKTVHVKNQTDANILKERKAKKKEENEGMY